MTMLAVTLYQFLLNYRVVLPDVDATTYDVAPNRAAGFQETSFMNYEDFEIVPCMIVGLPCFLAGNMMQSLMKRRGV